MGKYIAFLCILLFPALAYSQAVPGDSCTSYILWADRSITTMGFFLEAQNNIWNTSTETPLTVQDSPIEKEPYQVKSVIIPAALSLCAGMSADTDAGRIGQQTCLFGATFTIGLTKRPTSKAVLINFGISGVSFLAGRGIREIIK